MKRLFLALLLLGIALQLVGCRLPPSDEQEEPIATQTEPRRTPEPRREEMEELEERLNTTDLEVEGSAHPDPARVNESLTITINVVNNGPNPATRPQVVYRLTDGIAYISSSADCRESSPHVLTCALNELLARDSVTIKIEGQVADSAPTTIRNVVEVENLAGPDPSPENNTAAIDIQIDQ